MNKILIVLGFISFNCLLSAEQTIQKAEFTGQGRIETAPDFITLDFSVTSQCYETPLQAQESTDKVVKEIHDYLQTLQDKNDPHFKILVSGGYTSNFSKWNKDREVCQNTFQKVTSITLKITPEPSFDKTFAAIQAHSLKYFTQEYGSKALESPVTFVHINAPTPSISPKHQAELDREALNLALLNAKDKFQAATQSCQKQPWKILQISEDSSSYIPPPRPLHYAKTAMMESRNQGAEAAAPVSFDDLVTERSLRVTFMFEGAMCYTP